MDMANLSHRLLNFLSCIFGAGLLLLQIGIVLAQEPAITLTPITGSFDKIPIGSTFSINCTVTIPDGYMIGNAGVPSAVIWETEKAKIQLTTNATVSTNDSRITLRYSVTGIHHSFQLTIANIKSSDSGLYACNTYISHTDTPSKVLSETVYLSISDLLNKDKPRCYIRPGEVILEDLSISPTCLVTRDDNIDKMVRWSVLLPNGSVESILNSPVKGQGLNYESYHFAIDAIKAWDDGMRYSCNLMFANDDTPMQSCTTDVLNVIPGPVLTAIPGPELIGDHLMVDADVGETLSVSARIELPSGFYVSGTTWSKIIDGEHQPIIDNDAIVDELVDPNRFSIEKVNLKGLYSSTMKISDIQSSDSGHYGCYVAVSSNPDINIGNYYLRLFQITVEHGSRTISSTNMPTTQKAKMSSQRRKHLTSVKLATGITIVILILIIISAYVKHCRRLQRAKQETAGNASARPSAEKNGNINLTAI
ncbi:uncharacterized protein [Amphiura filiformis]|uniref:uncharacterized protein n=1 Tax=Amphiura filiformis TaxID=82378 RepID=UPI003B21AA66